MYSLLDRGSRNGTLSFVETVLLLSEARDEHGHQLFQAILTEIIYIHGEQDDRFQRDHNLKIDNSVEVRRTLQTVRAIVSDDNADYQHQN